MLTYYIYNYIYYNKGGAYSMEELLNLYINITYGYQIDTKERNKIKNIVGYLYDNNYTNKFIIEYEDKSISQEAYS